MAVFAESVSSGKINRPAKAPTLALAPHDLGAVFIDPRHKVLANHISVGMPIPHLFGDPID